LLWQQHVHALKHICWLCEDKQCAFKAARKTFSRAVEWNRCSSQNRLYKAIRRRFCCWSSLHISHAVSKPTTHLQRWDKQGRNGRLTLQFITCHPSEQSGATSNETYKIHWAMTAVLSSSGDRTNSNSFLDSLKAEGHQATSSRQG